MWYFDAKERMEAVARQTNNSKAGKEGLQEPDHNTEH